MIPYDLLIVLAYCFLMRLAITLPGLRESPLRAIIALPFLFFLPGYVLLAVLFPNDGAPRRTWDSFRSVLKHATSRHLGERGISRVERVAISFGTSLAILPLLGLVIDVLPLDFSTQSVYIVVGGFIVLGVCAGTVRRLSVPAANRLTLMGSVSTNSNATRGDHILTIVLAVSIVAAVSMTAYALVVPAEGPGFTTLSLGTRSDDGGFTAAGYPTQVADGTAVDLTIAIENNEGTTREYTLVVVIQRLSDPNQGRIVEQRELGRFTERIDRGEKAYIDHSVDPEITGRNLRLVYLLYEKPPPAQPTIENAHRSVFLWIDVNSVDENPASSRDR